MTRKELLNSPEYWQDIAENQCYRENIDYTLQLVDKKQMIDKALKYLSGLTRCAVSCIGEDVYVPVLSEEQLEDFKKVMEDKI